MGVTTISRGIFALFAGILFVSTTVDASAVDRFFVSDKNTQRVYKYDDSFASTANWPTAVGNANPDDVYITDTEVYVLDATAKKVFRYDYAGLNVVETATLKIPGTAGSADIGVPNGMSVDPEANELWVSDTSKIYRFSLSGAFSATGSVNALNQWNLHNSNGTPNGLTLDSTYVYVLDRSQQRLYRYLRSNPADHTPSRKFRTEAGVKLSNPEGIAVSGDLLYVLNNEAQDRVFRFSMFDIFIDPGTANAYDSFPLAAGNSNPFGIGINKILAVASITTVTTGPTNLDTLTFNVKFSQPVINFNDAADIITTHTGTASTGVTITGSGSQYTVDITGVTGDGTVQIEVNTASDIQDVANDPLLISGVSPVVLVDNTAPILSSVSPNSGSEIIVTFNELNGMSADALLPASYSVSGPGLGTLSPSPDSVTALGGNSYQLNWSGVSSINGLDITVTAAATLTDAAGNAVSPSGNSFTTTALPVSLSGFTVE